MTFQRWAKEFLLRELECEGTVIYHKKGGWYCVTPHGFLLHVLFDRMRFGDLSLVFEITPLIEKKLYSDNFFILPACRAEFHYAMINRISLHYMYDQLRSKNYESPETEETLRTIIHDFINPVFKSLTSYEKYVTVSIYISLAEEVSGDLLNAAVNDILTTGESCHVAVPNGYQDYPSYYPWYSGFMSSPPNIYAAIGMYQNARCYIYGRLEHLLARLRKSVELGIMDSNECENRERFYEEEYHEIRTAIESNDRDQIRVILGSIYHNNRHVIKDVLGIDLPEEWEQFVFEPKQDRAL